MWGSLSAPPHPLAAKRGPTSNGGEGRGRREEGEGGKGRVGGEEGRRRVGDGGEMGEGGGREREGKEEGGEGTPQEKFDKSSTAAE